MVHFVGAGSGAADLITVRGAKLLSEADVIIWAGSLVNPALLTYARPGCELHDSARMTLEGVVAVIREAEAAGKTTVRLHTGDPCLFGAVREQFDALDALGIEYDVCPGVSAFCGAAAALKCEYTLPEIAQSVVVARAAGRTPVPDGQAIRDFAGSGSTLVLFLSAALAQDVQAQLIEGGCSPDTPAAVVYRATWPDEKVLRCTVGTLAQTVLDNDISKTALIVVGKALGGYRARSRLYDPGFSTGYREANP